ncbi:MAG TPA: DMT family transporter [Gemmataceae bacterium]|nr:DMT family transporter [Gemmataceae bacterium]
MLLGSFCFAWMATAAHALRSSYDWQVIAVARSTIPFVLGAALTVFGGARLVLFTPRILWVRSIAGSISLVCTFFALTVLPPSHVFTLASTFPIWVALLSWPLYHERPTRQVWLSVLGSVLGIAVMEMSTASLENAENTAFAHWLAVLSTLIAGVSTAVAMLGLHRLRHIHPWAIVAHFSGVALLFSLASFLLGSHSATPPLRHSATPPQAETWLLLLAVGSTATVGQLFLTKAFAAGPPAKISVVSLMQVVFALLLDVMFWQRHFNALTLAGMALAMAPTAWLMATQEKNN